jgi:phosphonate transport system ATP-binding protein
VKPAPAIEIDQLVVRAGERMLLNVPRLRIAAGERVAIVGANGAGKSTLLRVLNGFVPVGQGRVRVLGRELGPALRGTALRALRAEIGPVHQGLHLVPRLSARENALIGALARLPGWRSWARLFPPTLVAEADAALATVGLLARADERVDRLSGGERQKVSIARMRLQRPRLILADEPTANLDPAAAAEACTWLRAAADAAPGTVLLTVVHQLALLPPLADRVIGLQAGRVVFDRALDGAAPGDLDRLYLPGDPASAAESPPTRAKSWLTSFQPAHGDTP